MAGETMVIVAIGMLETTRLLIRSKLAPVAVDYRIPRMPEELAQLLNTREFNVTCVLLDSDYLEDKGQAALRTIRAVSKTVPVIVLSSEQDRNYYISAIRWGVSGFIVKPYKDDAIRKKLMECYHAQNEKSVEMITFDLDRYLLGEFHKAEKGHFGLSYMFATVVLDDPDEQGNVMSQSYYLNLLYETIRHLFWDTDAFIKLNSRFYLGVFPFCGQRNIETLMRKIINTFNALHTTKKIPPYVRLVTAFSSYPEDGAKFLDVQRALADRIRAKIGETNMEWFI